MTEECCAPGTPREGRRAFDLAVVGAGSAGFATAIRAAELDAQVALIGHGTIGGTCVNVGCVPSKTLIRATETLHQARVASRFKGIHGEARINDWSAVVAQKNDLISDLRQSKYVDILPAYNSVAYYEGRARLVPEGVLLDGDTLKADKVIIATGASPVVPPIPGMSNVPCLTSTTALELTRLPESLLVIGGGYVGVELAQMFARAGVAVTIVCRSRLLPGSEPEISKALTDYFADEGIVVRCGVSYEKIRKTEKGVALSLRVNGELDVIEAEQVLAATGRRPNTDGLGLEDVGVAVKPEGGVEVDEFLRTTNDSVYAVGDVTGRDMHVYMAAYAGKVAAGNALGGSTRKYDASAMPAVTFTDPQVATVGLTERQARDQGADVKTSVLPLEHVPRALAARDTRGLVKLVADKQTDRLLGAHILAAEAGDSVQTAALAIKTGMTVVDLAETIFPYLTTVEALKLAAQAFEKDVAMLSCCAG